MTSESTFFGMRDLPAHLAPLVPDEWALWRWFALRGAGFPVHLVSRLSDPECARSADALLDAEGRVHAARSAALEAVNAQLDDLARRTGPKQEDFYHLVAILRALRSGKAPGPSPGATLDPLLQHLSVMEAGQRSRQSQYEAEFVTALQRQSTAVLEIASDPSFQEALLWQNRQAFENTLKPVTESGPAEGRGKKQRHYQELVANYLQRYTTKNDTIGFFGPVAWGTIGQGGPALKVTLGPSLVRERRVYFEEWGIEDVATVISSIDGMRGWIAPRIGPSLSIAGHSAHVAGRPSMPLDALTEAVLENCTGEIAANRLPALVRRKRSLDCTTDEEIEHLLCALAEKGVILWRFIVPMEPNPEIALRSALERVGDARLRAQGLAVLDRLEEKRREVACSAGCVQELAPALGALDREFRSITGKDAQRNAGVTYASRTLVYEDCRRDLEIRVSDKLFEPVVPAISLLLDGVRWFVQSMANAFQGAVESAYEEVAASLGTPEVPAGVLWLKLQPMISQLPPPAREVERLLDEKWAGILRLAGGVRECRFESRKLRPLVEAAFPVLPSTPGAPRYFCPDLMLAAPGLETIERGEALYVMGELHLSVNTLSSGLFVEQHPDPRLLEDAVAWDFPGPRVRAIHSRHQSRVSVRTNPVLMQNRDLLVAWGHDTIPPTGLRAHPIGTLVVRKTCGGIAMSTQDGRRPVGIMEAFAAPLCELLVNNARFVPCAEYTPRVLIDNLVISRESWTVPVRELTFAFEKQEHRRFLESRRWAARRGLPDIFFVKSPFEIKPSCVHLDSPVYVEIFCKMIRGLQSEHGADAQVKFSEMLPRPGQTWLADAAGNHYTAELRFAILDLRVRAADLAGETAARGERTDATMAAAIH